MMEPGGGGPRESTEYVVHAVEVSETTDAFADAKVEPSDPVK
jgi:hypothetical protein